MHDIMKISSARLQFNSNQKQYYAQLLIRIHLNKNNSSFTADNDIFKMNTNNINEVAQKFLKQQGRKNMELG